MVMERPAETLGEIFTRYPTLEDVTIRHFDVSEKLVIRPLQRLTRLRKLALFPYTNATLGNLGVVYMGSRTCFGALEEVSLRHEGHNGNARVRLTPESLLQLAQSFPKLTKLDIDVKLDGFGDNWMTISTEPETVAPLRELHLTPVGLADGAILRFAVFLLDIFPELEVFSVARDKFNSSWDGGGYIEHRGLADAYHFEAARRLKA